MRETVSGTSTTVMWLLGAVFTVCLLVVGLLARTQDGRLTAVETEVRRVGQLQSRRGERITAVEVQLKAFESLLQQLAGESVAVRSGVNPSPSTPVPDFPELR